MDLSVPRITMANLSLLSLKQLFLELHTERVTSPDDKSENVGSERLIIAVLVTMVIASTCGFFAGHRLSRWKLVRDGRQNSSDSSTGSSIYLQF